VIDFINIFSFLLLRILVLAKVTFHNMPDFMVTQDGANSFPLEGANEDEGGSSADASIEGDLQNAAAIEAASSSTPQVCI